MTQEQILEGNKLIAEFMGVIVKVEVKKNDWVKGNKMVFAQSNLVKPFIYLSGWSNHVFPKDNLDEKIKECVEKAWKEVCENAKYHTSWDWLMPACKKFSYDIGDDMHKMDEKIYDKYIEYCETIESCVASYKINEAFDYLTLAIQWYTSLTPKSKEQ